MPIFEFECLQCENCFEKLILGPNGEEGIACPQCGSGKVEKQFSGFSGRSRGSTGEVRSLSSGCSGCHASSCANCK